MKNLIIVFLSVFISNILISQDREKTLDVYGSTKNGSSFIKEATIEISKDGEDYEELKSNIKGDFDFVLAGSGEFLVKATKDGYHDRFIVFNTQSTSKRDYKTETFDFNLKLYKIDEELPEGALNIPVITYNAKSRNFQLSDWIQSQESFTAIE